MAVTHKLVTAEELLRMPDDGLRSELVRGEVRRMAPAGHGHGRVAINVSTPLDQHVRARSLGVVYAAETGFKIAGDPDTVRAPDVAFVSRERVEAVGESEGYWPGAPDLAVEVISPNDTYSEVEENVADWLRAVTRMVLVVNPRGKTVTVRFSEKDITVLTEGDTLDGGEVVPGWRLPVADVFR